ncbi:putative G-protein coupled receptor frpr-1 [Rhynchophorus ferrugineus]|uniref:putative G-protein coupled receptor frpr-1 n=1 Tax=Rhynchophorus ferrugineus TaxID=354439 RepID=UPI003FCE68B8
MSFYFISASAFRGDSDVWVDKPTVTGTVLYSVVTPILCLCGIFGNISSLIVLKRKELVGSVYTYLAVLAAMDLGMSIALFLGGISKGIMWSRGWSNYDSLIGLPLSEALNTVSVLAIVGLTIDRVIYLWNPVQCTKPKFCHPWVARRLMVISILIAILFNLPYCFIYTWDGDDTLTTTDFFDSRFYIAFNWITLFVFAVIPAIILLFGNGFLIMSLRKAKKINKRSCSTKRCKRRDHTNLTITLVMIIVFFLITNIPENLVSRTAAINLLFRGDHDRVNTEIIENLRQAYAILGAFDVNINFIFYYTFCPAFCKVLKSVWTRKKKTVSKRLQVNVFVLNAHAKSDKHKSRTEQDPSKKISHKVLEISRKSIESAFSIQLSDGEKDKTKNECVVVQHDNYGESSDVDLEAYVPPFSTIMEESTFSTNTNTSNKSQV